MTNYRVECGEVRRDRERVLALWHSCGFGGEPSAAAARYRWFYEQGPHGPGRIYLLIEQATGELVGCVGAGTRLFRTGDSMLRAALLVDFVISPAHRTMFPALQLQREARSAELKEADLVYGLPEPKAVPVFRRLGAAVQFEAGSYVRVLRSGHYLQKHLPRAPRVIMAVLAWMMDRLLVTVAFLQSAGQRAQWQDELPVGPEESEVLTGYPVECAMGTRDKEYLGWRCQQDRGSIRTLLVRDRLTHAPIAWFICRVGEEEAQVVDFALPGESEAAIKALSALTAACWGLGLRALRTSFGGCERTYKVLGASGFSLRESRPCFIVPGPLLASACPHDWWLTKADEDVW